METKPSLRVLELSPLMIEATNAYGIEPWHVLTFRDHGPFVRIVTKGGRRVSFERGDRVAKLSPIELSGSMPAKEKVSSIRGDTERSDVL